MNNKAVEITKVVIAIADELGISPGNIALRWTMQQGFSSLPIGGGTKLGQLEENLKAVEVSVSDEQLKRLDAASAIELGFPGEFFAEEGMRNNNFSRFYDRVKKGD